MSSKTRAKKPSGLVQLDETARLQKELKEKKAKPRNLWRRDWSK
jgi:hypothetical protein